MNLRIATAICLLALLTATPALAQQGAPANPAGDARVPTELDVTDLRLDLSKGKIEMPLEQLVEHVTPLNAEPAGQPRDVEEQSRALMESSLEELVDRARQASLGETAAAGVASDANPACQPGLVQWHETFGQACAASRQSGKPVMLFQLLGRLDQRFT